MPTALVLASRFMLVAAATIEYCNKSVLNQVNLTALSDCLDQSDLDFHLYTRVEINGTREQIYFYSQVFGLTDGKQMPPDQQVQNLKLVADCLREHNAHRTVVNNQMASYYNDAVRTYQYSKFQGRSNNSGLKKRENNGPADARGYPTHVLQKSRAMLYAGDWGRGTKYADMSDLSSGTCYSTPGKIGDSMTLQDNENFEADFMHWPHHCCRSRSKDGSNYKDGVVSTVDSRTEFYVNERVGSFWIQTNSKQGWPGPDTGTADANPCVQWTGGSGY